MTSDEELIQKAVLGDVSAMKSLALLYELGIEREQDLAKSFKWWKNAALAGDSQAQLNTAEMLSSGEGIEPNHVEAQYWRFKANSQKAFSWNQSRSSIDQEKKSIKKVLIVDDEPLICSMLASLCAELGCDAIPVQSAKDAVKVINDQPGINLVLLDNVMPEFSGIQFLSLVRRMKFISGVPIVVISGQSEKSHVEHFKKLGISLFITKPMKPEAVSNALKKYLDLK